MSWGIGEWGIGEWGLGESSSLEIESVYALSENTFRISLSEDALVKSPITQGDAQNPNTWVVTRQDTGAVLTTLAINRVDARTFDFYLLQKFSSSLIMYEVTTSKLRTSSGIIIPSPLMGEFLGCVAARITRSSAPTMVDVRSVQTAETAIGGTFQVDASGSYEMEGGVDLLRKLIIRRLITMPGEYFYLTAYGVGFRVKEPVPSGDLVKLRASIENQLMREPEFSRVQVRLALDSSNMLTVGVNARLAKNNEDVTVLITAQPPRVNL